MNAITIAMKRAGLNTPSQSELLWRRIKEEPGLTSKQLKASLASHNIKDASSLLSQMTKRGMVFTKPGDDGRLTYHTDMPTYRILKPITAKKTAAPAPVQQAPKLSHGVDLESMTLGQLRLLLADLSKLFGGK
jgi:hypothetical protein